MVVALSGTSAAVKGIPYSMMVVADIVVALVDMVASVVVDTLGIVAEGKMVGALDSLLAAA